MTLTDGSCDAPGGFVLLSEGYRPEAVTAGPRSWPTVDIPGTHLDIVNRPEGIAQTLTDLTPNVLDSVRCACGVVVTGLPHSREHVVPPSSPTVGAHEIPDDAGSAEYHQNKCQLLHASPKPVSEEAILTDQPRMSNRTLESATLPRGPAALRHRSDTPTSWSGHPSNATPQVASEARPPLAAYVGARSTVYP